MTLWTVYCDKEEQKFSKILGIVMFIIKEKIDKIQIVSEKECIYVKES